MQIPNVTPGMEYTLPKGLLLSFWLLSLLLAGVVVSCGVGCRCSSDPVLLQLWCWLAAAALIQPLA